jgi:hypothetical protein
MKKSLAIMSASACAALSPAVAGAQAADSWQFGAALNTYLPTIKGTTRFPGNGAGSDASIDSGQILDSLKMTFMGTLEARKGQWGAFTDIPLPGPRQLQVRYARRLRRMASSRLQDEVGQRDPGREHERAPGVGRVPLVALVRRGQRSRHFSAARFPVKATAAERSTEYQA